MRWIVANIWLLLLFCFRISYAQEQVAPLQYNAAVSAASAQKAHNKEKGLLRTTSLSLPFFEDFTGYSIFPDSNKWIGNQVYVNNTMGVNPVSRGVVTFDALNQNGVPYNIYNTTTSYADTLTTQPINLTAYGPADSLYLSFFYQPQGNGFAPLPQDSIALYLHKSNNDWVRVWLIPGDTLQPFTQVMIPITDSAYFFNGFQFRFINMATFNYGGSTWNIDYIRLNAHRSITDTAVNDVAFTTDPTYILNDYSYMPYRQFLADTTAERANEHSTVIKNDQLSSQSVQYAYTATELTTKTNLYSSGFNTATIPGADTQTVKFPAYKATIPSPGIYNPVVFENKYFFQSIPGQPTVNDTIIKDQVFDNYLAYDDGSAEKAWYLKLGETVPGKFVIEYHLNQPDTLRGMAVYFGRQIPLAGYKFFNFVVYKGIAGITPGYASDDTLFFEPDNSLSPAYTDTINHFWIYRFDTPVALPAGTFYAGMFIPAYSGSDSLYIGLDVNRIGSNHVFFNVNSFTWNISEVRGALMVRPLLGQPIMGTNIKNVEPKLQSWNILPNPATDNIHFEYAYTGKVTYRVLDIQGRTVLQGNLDQGNEVDISHLTAGMYIAYLYFNDVESAPKKFIKL